jgi:hypothetical protein
VVLGLAFLAVYLIGLALITVVKSTIYVYKRCIKRQT